MNARIWELDRCENGNGRRLKYFAGDLRLRIMTCVWKGMSGATWFMDDREFTLDYVCKYRWGLSCMIEAMDEEDVIYSDHSAVSMSIKWKTT